MNFPYKHINILVMPTDFCNMNCVYCFNSQRTHAKENVISDDLLRQMFQITIPFYEKVTFIWHGGEPLSMGLDFFTKVVKFQEEVNKTSVVVRNSIQSNLTLLNADYAKGLLDLGYHIGGSYDGTQNQLTRGCDSAIINGHDAIIKAGGKSGVICVVQSRNIDHLIDDYEWFKSKGISYTLNAYLTVPPYECNALYVEPSHFVSRIIELYEYWIRDSSCNIGIDYFMIFIDYFLFKKRTLCCYTSCLGKYVGIHYNGDISPCNRDFPKKYYFGNVFDYKDIHECFSSDGFDKLAKDAVLRRKRCMNCKIFNFCNGGCNNNALLQGDITKAGGFSCQILIPVYEHIERSIEQIKTKSLNELAKNCNPRVFDALMRYKDPCSNS